MVVRKKASSLISVVIPVYNEAQNLPLLFTRLKNSLDALNRAYEIIFTNDGSRDDSIVLLKEFQKQHSKLVRVIDFQSNFGQHMAIMAAFSKAKGEVIVTIDADLQNPPEEIYKLIEKFDEGYDCIGSIRANRQDSFYRTYISKIVNYVRERITSIKMVDQGCMLRAYSRDIILKIVESNEAATYIPALAYHLSHNPTDVVVQHSARAFGESKYNLYSLIRLNFDIITGFSMVPLQMFTIFGMTVSFFSGLLAMYIFIRRFILGAEVEGVFTLFAILFFLISVLITGIGIVGEYLGRIFQHISNRPRYIIKKIYEN